MKKHLLALALALLPAAARAGTTVNENTVPAGRGYYVGVGSTAAQTGWVIGATTPAAGKYLTVVGSMTATYVAGDGSGLTNLPGVSAGTITANTSQFSGTGSASSPLTLISSSVTLQGNSFNAAGKLVQSDAAGNIGSAGTGGVFAATGPIHAVDLAVGPALTLQAWQAKSIGINKTTSPSALLDIRQGSAGQLNGNQIIAESSAPMTSWIHRNLDPNGLGMFAFNDASASTDTNTDAGFLYQNAGNASSGYNGAILEIFTGFGDTAPRPIMLTIQGSKALFVDTSSRVGISTGVPAYSLDVAGVMRATAVFTNAGGLAFSTTPVFHAGGAHFLGTLASGSTFYSFTTSSPITLKRISFTFTAAGAAGSGNEIFQCRGSAGQYISATIAVNGTTTAAGTGNATAAAGATVTCYLVTDETTRPTGNLDLEYWMQ